MRVTDFDRGQNTVELSSIEATSSAPSSISDGYPTNGAPRLYIQFHDDVTLTSMTIQVHGALVDSAGALVGWAPIQDANYTITAGGGGTDAIDVRQYNRFAIEVTALTGTGGPDLTDVRLATVAALPACTAAGTGVGKTLTGDAVGLLSIDGVATVNADRVLVKNQAAADDNGVYDVTEKGDAGTAFILTRATDADTAGELTQLATVDVTAGDTLTGTTWRLATAIATMDTTPQVWTEAASAVASVPVAYRVG